MRRPGILDAYVLREFTVYCLLALLFFTGIYAIVDVFDKFTRFLDAGAGAAEMLRYMVLNVPFIVITVMPMSILLGGLMAMTQLEKFRELTAMNVTGRSFLRMSLPMLGVALLASGVSFYLEEYVAPEANRARRDFMDQRIARAQAGLPSQRENVLYLGAGGRVFVIRTYLVAEMRMVEPVIEEFRGSRLARRIDAHEGQWDGRQWVFKDGVTRVFSGEGEHAVRFARMEMPTLAERPPDFASEELNPAEMRLSRLGGYIRRLAESGRPVQRYLVDYQIKLSFPLINFVALLLALGIMAHLRRSTPALVFGLAAAASFTFYGLVATARALGQGGVIAPWVAAWLGHAVYGGIAAVMLARSPR